MRSVSVLVLMLALLSPVAVLADCRVHPNDRVVLYGTTDDPDVFVWDSRFRLRDYEGGTFDQMKALLPHATLVRPGTRAMVESCVADFVQSKYVPQPDDAVGIVITAGPLRGQRGWVIGSAIRQLTSVRARKPGGRPGFPPAPR
ncbi:MAG TPA: hypothetical protein VMD47_00240 [Candidatus Acidoferrales bacterium]|nr:hypothetical protein [Candidatus Acidoferrales bacterium]